MMIRYWPELFWAVISVKFLDFKFPESSWDGNINDSLLSEPKQ